MVKPSITAEYMPADPGWAAQARTSVFSLETAAPYAQSPMEVAKAVPLRTRSIARALPIARVRRCVPPAPGIRDPGPDEPPASMDDFLERTAKEGIDLAVLEEMVALAWRNSFETYPT